jgi:folate-binding protein YgfZ
MVLDLQTQNFVFDRGEVDLLVLSGPDSDDFLNRLSTQNFKKEFSGSLHGAFLNGQAKLISIFTSWKSPQKTYFFLEKEMFQKTKDYLEKMHFAEDLKIETEKYFCIESRGNGDFRSEISADAYDWGLSGKYFFSKNKFNSESISELQYDAIRAHFGFPKPLKDLTADHILIEGPMDNFVDRNKGCYPGQEVIEKIYTYGRVARKIKKILLENANSTNIEVLIQNLPQEIEVDGKNIGVLTSVYHSQKSVGLVTLKRHFYEKHQSFPIPLADGTSVIASIIETGPIT